MTLDRCETNGVLINKVHCTFVTGQSQPTTSRAVITASLLLAITENAVLFQTSYHCSRMLPLDEFVEDTKQIDA